MGFDPVVGGEVGGDAGGEQGKRGADGEEDPGEFDAALEHEVVEEAEDQDEHGGFCEEGRAAAAGDDGKLEQARGRRLHLDEVCGFCCFGMDET